MCRHHHTPATIYRHPRNVLFGERGRKFLGESAEGVDLLASSRLSGQVSPRLVRRVLPFVQRVCDLTQVASEGRAFAYRRCHERQLDRALTAVAAYSVQL